MMTAQFNWIQQLFSCSAWDPWNGVVLCRFLFLFLPRYVGLDLIQLILLWHTACTCGIDLERSPLIDLISIHMVSAQLHLIYI